MKTFEVRGWVQVSVYAEITAKNEREARKIWEASGGNGNPDGFSYEEGNWGGPVYLDSIREKVNKSEDC